MRFFSFFDNFFNKSFFLCYCGLAYAKAWGLANLFFGTKGNSYNIWNENLLTKYSKSQKAD